MLGECRARHKAETAQTGAGSGGHAQSLQRREPERGPQRSRRETPRNEPEVRFSEAGYVCNQVLDICLCHTAGIATDKRLVYGKRQGITQPASASNIAVPCANPVERGGARCVEDDPFRCTPERSSDECHPPDRNPR